MSSFEKCAILSILKIHSGFEVTWTNNCFKSFYYLFIFI